MKTPNIKGLMGLGKSFVMANRPEILFATAVVSTVGAVVLAAKAGYDARGLVEEAQNPSTDLDNPENPLSTKEKAKLTWLCYSAPAIATLGAVGATTGLHIIHVKEKKALAQMALAAVDELQQVAKEYEVALNEVDPEKAKEVEDKVHTNRSAETGTSTIVNGDGEVEELYLIRDPYTGRDIWSNMTRIEMATVHLGNLINGQAEASLNDFYEEAGWVPVEIGNHRGWSGVIPSISWNDVNGMPLTGVRDDGRPWRSFRFLPEPAEGYEGSYA